MDRKFAAVYLILSAVSIAAPRDRITQPIDAGRVRAIPGKLHQRADPNFDRGAVDPATPINDVLIMFKRTPEQQADLDRLLADQQNPSSQQFHKWLTPEQYADRFGLSQSDHSKIAAWLHSQGFTVHHAARSRNWISFHGTAAQISKSFHTPIHRFQAGTDQRYSNTAPPSVPEA